MKSMTGFASVSSENFSIKLKSVNHRFYDFRYHGPQDLLSYEKELRQKIGQVVSRGSLDLFVQVQFESSKNNSQMDLKKAKEFHADLKKLSNHLKVDLVDELNYVLRYGDLFSKDSKTIGVESITKESFFKAIDVLLKDFDNERLREGKALNQDLKEQLGELEKVRLTLDSLAKDYPKEIEAKIKEKLKAWKNEIDLERMNPEILLLIDKSDISEEIVRLKEHIKACQKLLNSKVSEGKKLDFYAQELFREANTIGSKSSSVKITQEVMQAKAIIEKIRQQVQNIE